MNIDQIAAEAAHILCGNVIHKKDKDWATGIIKAACEKVEQAAHKAGYSAALADVKKFQRAAQVEDSPGKASEK